MQREELKEWCTITDWVLIYSPDMIPGQIDRFQFLMLSPSSARNLLVTRSSWQMLNSVLDREGYLRVPLVSNFRSHLLQE